MPVFHSQMTDTTTKQVESQSVPPTAMPRKTPPFNPVHLLTWISGAFSLLHLIRDLTPVELFGLAKEWVDAYGLLVRRVTTFLFGWINWRWISVSDNEGHVVVLAWLLSIAFSRAIVNSEPHRSDNATGRVLTAVTTGVVMISPVWVVALLLADPWGVAAGGLIVAFFGAIILFVETTVPQAPTLRDIRGELLGVGAVTLLLVILNYTVFRTL